MLPAYTRTLEVILVNMNRVVKNEMYRVGRIAKQWPVPVAKWSEA
jgi:hypothetical protein